MDKLTLKKQAIFNVVIKLCPRATAPIQTLCNWASVSNLSYYRDHFMFFSTELSSKGICAFLLPARSLPMDAKATDYFHLSISRRFSTNYQPFFVVLDLKCGLVCCLTPALQLSALSFNVWRSRKRVRTILQVKREDENLSAPQRNAYRPPPPTPQFKLKPSYAEVGQSCFGQNWWTTDILHGLMHKCEILWDVTALK